MKPLDSEKTAKEIVDFIKKSFSTAGFSKAVIGVSGGVDSAVSCALTAQALGNQNVYPVILPYGILSTRGTLDAMEFIGSLKIPLNNIYRFDIKPAVDAIASKSNFMNDLRRGNIMARMRMIVLYDQAKYRQALVVGTENKSECLLGYFTRFGDEASDIEPIIGFYKTQVLELAKFLHIPQVIIDKPPSADLWGGQTDEGEFGFTYKEADEIMHIFIEENKKEKEIVNAGFNEDLVNRVIMRIKNNKFKHMLPVVPG